VYAIQNVKPHENQKLTLTLKTPLKMEQDINREKAPGFKKRFDKWQKEVLCTYTGYTSDEVCYHSVKQTASSLNLNCFPLPVAVILIIDFKKRNNDHPVTHHTNNKIKKVEIRATNKMAEISRK